MKKYLILSLLILPMLGRTQSVQVTATLDTNIVSVGESTNLRIFAQVIPSLQANSDRIFSWYVDVLNGDGTVATADYGALVKAASDNGLTTSGNGTNDGDHQRGIYDTLLNLSGAGVNEPVELISIPVMGQIVGETLFSVAAGSGVGLASDFIVAPSGGGDPMFGGVYSEATVTLQVNQVLSCTLTLQISRGTPIPEPNESLDLSFVPCVGFHHVVEFANVLGDLGTNTMWMPLSNAPHNTGMITVTNSLNSRYFRVSATPQ
jgi:hypothetical protein